MSRLCQALVGLLWRRRSSAARRLFGLRLGIVEDIASIQCGGAFVEGGIPMPPVRAPLRADYFTAPPTVRPMLAYSCEV